MGKKIIMRLGLVILVVGKKIFNSRLVLILPLLILLGTCISGCLIWAMPLLILKKDKDHHDTISGSSGFVVEYLSSVQANPDAIFINEPTEITIRVAIGSNLNVTSVNLLKLDANNNVIETLGTLVDDGDLAQGDDIALDGVFSMKYSFTVGSTGKIKLKISCEGGGNTIHSEVFQIDVLKHLSEAEFADTLAKPDQTLAKYEELSGTYGAETAKTKTVEWLQTQPTVVQASVAESGNGIWYVLETGVLGGILLETEGFVEGGGRDDHTDKTLKPLKNPPLLYKSNLGNGSVTQLKTILNSGSSQEETTAIKSTKAIVIAPFNWSWKTHGTDFEDNVYNILNNSTFPKYDLAPKYYDADATVEVFKTLDDYGIVIIHTHGGMILGNEVGFLTGQEITGENGNLYEKDLLLKRLWFAGIEGVETSYFAILPSFIAYYNSSFPNSLIYAGYCEGTYNDTMANAFINNGAQTYFGFSESVISDYDRDCANTLFDKLIAGDKNTGDAFSDTIAACGENDKYPSWSPIDLYPPLAYFQMKGNDKLSLEISGIPGGDFETGNLSAWNTQGDARIITKLGPLSCPQGKYIGIISTGLGSIDDSNSYISQTFYVPAGVTSLSFDYNVVSEEPMEFVGSMYDDKFEALLTTTGGDVTIASETVNTSIWYEVNGIDFYGGDETVYLTGWKHITYDVSYLGASTVTLKFHVWDKGDSIYDTAALVDNIKLE